MKKILLILVVLLSAMCVYAQNTQSLGVVYSLGIFNSTITDGVVVGSGEYVLTTRNAIFEETNQTKNGKIVKTYGHINKYPLFLSNETGDIYECETVAVDKASDLALLKLPKKLTYTNQIEENTSKFPDGTFKVLYKGKKLISNYYGIDRNDETGDFFLKEFASKTGLLETTYSGSKVYMCDVDKNYLLPGGMYIKDKKFYGILNIMQPLTDYNVKPAKEVVGGQFSLGKEMIKYCKDNNIPFENGETVAGNDNSKLSYLKNINNIINGVILYGSKETQEAYDAYPLKDASYYANILLAMSYEGENKIEDAKKYYEKAISILPEAPYAQMRLANLKGDKITLLNKLSEKYPNDSRIYDRLARCYAEQENYEMARSFISRGLMFSENDPEMLLEKAKYEKGLKNYDGVWNAINEINKIAPTYIDALIFAAKFAIEIKDVNSAVAVCKQWLRVEPYSPLANATMANACFLAGETQLGKEYLDKAKEPNEETKKYIDELESSFVK